MADTPANTVSATVRILDKDGGQVAGTTLVIALTDGTFAIPAGVLADHLFAQWHDDNRIEVLVHKGLRRERWACDAPKFADDGGVTFTGKVVRP